ncbi:hypothetical protein Hanom_Chr10g00885241 [Helianthus anomalus]
MNTKTFDKSLFQGSTYSQKPPKFKISCFDETNLLFSKTFSYTNFSKHVGKKTSWAPTIFGFRKLF